MRPLLPKQLLFIKEYLVDKNATRAATAAGYSARNAGRIGHELLNKTQIRQEIDRALAEETKKVQKRVAKQGITKERIMKELALIGFADMKDFAVVNERGVRLVTEAERRKGRSRVIKKLSESTSTNGGHQSVELNPKVPALELLAKLGGWIKEKVEHSGEGGGPIQYADMTADKLAEKRKEIENALKTVDDADED